MKKPVVAITMGDPAGIGPELCLKALADARVTGKCVPLVFGDASVLERVGKLCGLKSRHQTIPIGGWKDNPCAIAPSVVDCMAVEAGRVKPGKVQALCGEAAYIYIKHAVTAAMAGHVAGIATAPIHKMALHKAGRDYPGHTEMLAKFTGTRRFCMMMAAEEFKVSLVTTHAGIAEVAGLISYERVLDVINLTHAMLKRIGTRKPHIAVCGLNPHGGENGIFGREEIEIINPAVRKAVEKGMRVKGPLSPDTAFLPSVRRGVDAYVVMYHDQGLIPFKMLAFDKGVNITLGLPVVRTSVDHGTAFDIAWKGKASAESMLQSILWAARLAEGGDNGGDW